MNIDMNHEFLLLRFGFLIIDECPSVDADNYSPTLLKRHKDSLSELIRRDKNRPSVMLWSVANEPRTAHYEAGMYFKQVIRHTRYLDSSRPVTMAISTSYEVRINCAHSFITAERGHSGYFLRRLGNSLKFKL